MDEAEFTLVNFDSDEGECETCGSPTHNAFGQRIKCACDYSSYED